MSRCISSHGEYSAHETDDDHDRCARCRVWTCSFYDQDEPYPLDGDDHECDPESSVN